MWIFIPYLNLYSKTSQKFYRQFTKTKLKIREKIASSRFNYKERQVVLTVHKLSEHDFWQDWLCNSYRFGDKFLTSLTKLVLGNERQYLLYNQRKSALLPKFRICCRYHNLTHFYSKVCITKKPLTLQLSY